MSDIQLVLLASILVSMSVMCGFGCSWAISGRLYGKRYNYLIYYALFMLLSNIPKLIATVAGHPIHVTFWTVTDIVGLLLLFLAAEQWRNEGFRTWHWLIFLAGSMFAIAHNVAGSRACATGYAICVSLIMLITLMAIASRSPHLVTIFVGLSFLGWTALNLAFPHTGDIVGHAFGMATKVIVFGALMVAHYERQHRRIWQAARVRSLAIDIVAESPGAIKRVRNGGEQRPNGTWRPATSN